MDAVYQKGYIFMMKIMKSMRRLFAPILLLLFAALFMPVLGQTDAPTTSEILPCGPPHQVPREAYSLLEEGEALAGQEKWNEAIQAYDKAIQIDPQFDLAWKAKADLLQMLGREIEANEAYDKIEEMKEAHTTSILDHSMAASIDEITRNATSRANEFSADDSRAYSWLSLKNVQAGPLCGVVLWNLYSPAGDLLHSDSVNIPPINGDYWSTYNVWSNLDIAGHPAANLSGDWHADIFLNGQKILTEYFRISGDQPTIAPEDPEDQQPYSPGKYEETAYQETYNQLYDQGKKDEAINKGDRLLSEGRYDEAIYFYDQAINQDPNNWNNWKVFNSKGDALSDQGKYEEAIQVYNKAIELTPENPIAYGRKGAALKALGQINESNIAYATARELGDYSAWIPETDAAAINLTDLFHIEVLDHSMASSVDQSTNNASKRTGAFSSADGRVYSWLSLGHILGAEVEWHWYSPDGNPYKTGRVEIPRNQSGGFWPVYNVWYYLDIASIPTEDYMAGDWHVDIYINGQKRLTEQFNLKFDSGASKIPGPTSGASRIQGTFTVLDHAIATEIDDATDKPVTTDRTNEIKDALGAYSWLQLGNIGTARIRWDWHGGSNLHGGGLYEITHIYDIPPNPKSGYYDSMNVWDYIDISSMRTSFEIGESDEEIFRESDEEEGYFSSYSNPIPDPRGDWTVDVYLNDQWLFQEEFTVVSG